MDTKQVIVVRKDLNMRKGKLAAQVAHASMAFLTWNYNRKRDKHLLTTWLTKPEMEWLADSFAKVVVSVDSEEELRELISRGKEAEIQVIDIVDSGRTEFKGVPTLTCAAFGPDEVEKIDRITGHLKLI